MFIISILNVLYSYLQLKKKLSKEILFYSKEIDPRDEYIQNDGHDLDQAMIPDSDNVDAESNGSKHTNIDYSKSVEDIIADIESASLSLEPPVSSNGVATAATVATGGSQKSREVKFNEAIHSEPPSYRKQFMPNKQHTGMKNISSNVGAAVAPNSKMEFDQEHPESFGVVKINRPVGRLEQHDDAVSTISSINSEGLTEQGYFDLKFYHNKLW